MAGKTPRTFTTGAGIVWRRQRVLWWIFAASLFLSVLGTMRQTERVGQTLNHSLNAAPHLFHGMDRAAILELRGTAGSSAGSL